MRLLKTAFFIMLEAAQINRLFRYLNRGRVKVLLYHSITPRGQFFDNGVGPEDFAKQIKHLKKYYNLISAAQLNNSESCSAHRVNLLITFDDGFLDNRATATLILRQEGLSAIFFAIAACVPSGRSPDFVGQISVNSERALAFRTVDTDDVRAMIGYGMTLGSHGVDHADYSKLPYELGIRDARRSKEMLEALVPEADVDCFAFPWGRFQAGQEIDILSTYKRVFLTSHGFNQIGDRVMHRNEVFDGPQLWAAASGSLDYFRKWRVSVRE